MPTADQSGAEIKTAYENEADTNAFDDAAAAKLAAIEAGAQVNTVTSVFGETGAVDVASLTEETTPADADLILLEKAAAGGFRKLQVGNLPAGAGGTQIDLSALTHRGAGPVGRIPRRPGLGADAPDHH